MQSSAVVLPNAHGHISYRHRGRPTPLGLIYVARHDRSASVNGQPRGSLMTPVRLDTSRAGSPGRLKHS